MAAQFECLLPCGVDKQWQCFGLLPICEMGPYDGVDQNQLCTDLGGG